MSMITLTTDYGTYDYYTGALKGVILGIAPQVRIVDVTHEIEPHNIREAAFTLRQIWPWYRAGTVHLAVVDPGVGSDRRILLGKYVGCYLVAPDNGVVTLVHHDLPVEALHSVENPDFFLPSKSATFHGRDIMAPVAAYLSTGRDPAEFGPSIVDPVLLPDELEAVRTGKGLQGRVLHVDQFGTLVSNIRRGQVARLSGSQGAPEVWVNGFALGPVRATYGDVSVGSPLALIGGADLLEIAINQGRAVDRFGPPEQVRIDVQ